MPSDRQSVAISSRGPSWAVRAPTRASRSSGGSVPVTASIRRPRALRSQGGAQVFGEVVGGGDVAAEDDRVIAPRQQVVDQRGEPLELGVGLRAFQRGGRRGKLAQALAGSYRLWCRGGWCRSRARRLRLRVVSSRSVSSTRDSANSSTSSVLSAAVSADRFSRVCSAAAGLEARQRSSAMADHQRTRWCTLLSVRVGDLFARERHHLVEERPVGGGEPVAGLGHLAFRERGVLVRGTRGCRRAGAGS